jgi:quinol-cytochrome oxidoreductase complex cytochrome b subunit
VGGAAAVEWFGATPMLDAQDTYTTLCVARDGNELQQNAKKKKKPWQHLALRKAQRMSTQTYGILARVCCCSCFFFFFFFFFFFVGGGF